MQLRWSEIKTLPLGALQGTQKIGTIGDPIFNAENGTLLGCWVQTGFLTSRVLPWIAVREIEKQGVVTASRDELVQPGEVVRIEAALKSRCPILGQKAVRENGDKLGVIFDVSVDPSQGMLTKIHVRGGRGEQDIVHSKIIEITPVAVVVEAEEKVRRLADETAGSPAEAEPV